MRQLAKQCSEMLGAGLAGDDWHQAQNEMTQQVRGKWQVANSASLANNKDKPQEIRTSSDLADADARMVAAAFDSYVTKVN